MKTRKGAASIYIVIFTTTLLGIIALSFVRIMLAESMRTTNYSLSQSAYNSALAGIEDAKIVLLRYQSCVNNGEYTAGGGKTGNCNDLLKLFGTQNAAYETSQNCSIVGEILHPSMDNNKETLIQTRDNYDTGTVDQAYTCVKIAAYTEDFLATLNSKNPTKLIPLRSDSPAMQASINRIQIQWFDDQNYADVADGNGLLKEDEYYGFWEKDGGLSRKSSLEGTTISNKGDYSLSSKSDLDNSFTTKPLVPPVIQATLVQTADTFTMEQFYASEGTADNSKTNRGTLMLRPTSNKSDSSFVTSRKLDVSDDGSGNKNHSNVLPKNSLAYSANKSYNTPMDVYCKPNDSSWGNYACSADFFVPSPIGSTDGHRNMSTSFLVVNLPYGGPQTDISVKMLSCVDPTAPINSTVTDSSKDPNCKVVYFANVQPMVDSTGRANDLFRRVESRIELADTNFPIANYALAMTDPSNEVGIAKDYYVTNNCNYSSSRYVDGEGGEPGKIVDVNGCSRNQKYNASTGTCVNASGNGHASEGDRATRKKVCLDAAKNSSATKGVGNGDK